MQFNSRIPLPIHVMSLNSSGTFLQKDNEKISLTGGGFCFKFNSTQTQFLKFSIFRFGLT